VSSILPMPRTRIFAIQSAYARKEFWARYVYASSFCSFAMLGRRFLGRQIRKLVP
jgi:hypothetical protein